MSVTIILLAISVVAGVSVSIKLLSVREERNNRQADLELSQSRLAGAVLDIEGLQNELHRTRRRLNHKMVNLSIERGVNRVLLEENEQLTTLVEYYKDTVRNLELSVEMLYADGWSSDASADEERAVATAKRILHAVEIDDDMDQN